MLDSIFSLIKKTSWFIWHFHRKLVISLVVCAAIMLLFLRGSVFYLEQNPQQVQQVIESYLFSGEGQNTKGRVLFDSISVDTSLLFPSVSMQNFRLITGAESKPLTFTSASMHFNTWRSLTSGQIKLDHIAVTGVSLAVRRDKNNKWFVADVQLEQQEHNTENNIERYLRLFNQITFDLKNSDIYFIDETEAFPPLFISELHFNLKNKSSRHQISLQANLNHTKTRLDLRLDFSGAIHNIDKWDGQIYCSLTNMSKQTVSHLLKQESLQIENIQIDSVQANTKIWSRINAGKLHSITGEFALHNAQLSNLEDKRKITFDALSSYFKFARDAKKESLWTLNLFDIRTDFNGQSTTTNDISLNFSQANKQDNARLQVFLNTLDLGTISPLLSFFATQKLNEQRLKELSPKGKINNIIASLELSSLHMPITIHRYQLQADIIDLSLNAFASLPKVRHFSSHIILNESMGRAYIDSRDLTLHLKSLFRDAWQFSHLTGEFFWQKEGELWLFGAEQMLVNNDHLNATADVNLWWFNEQRLLMDLSGFYHDVNVKFVPDYLPVSIMGKELVNWLDNAFRAGQGTDGGVLFRGEFERFPFDDHSGILDVTFNVDDVLLDYKKGWPLLSDIDAQIQFTQRGLSVKANKSRLFSSVANNIEVNMAHYLDSVLTIKGDVKSNIADSHRFLQQSKLLSNEVLELLDAKGNIGLNLDISLDLDKPLKTKSKVRLTLKDNDYFPPGFVRKKGLVNHLKGDIVLHKNSINTQKLNAYIMGEKASISIKTLTKNNNFQKNPKINIEIDSKLAIKQLREFALMPESLAPLSHYLSGTTAVNITLELPNEQRGLAFKITSKLNNLSSTLPEPLSKKASEQSFFYLAFAKRKANDEQAQLDIRFSDVLSLVFLLDTKKAEFDLIKGNIALQSSQAKLPKSNILSITGSLNKLNLDRWQTVLSKNAVLGETKNKTFTTPIEFSLSELVLPEVNLTKKETSVRSKPSTIQTHGHPQNFPLINGSIQSVKMGKLDLGHLRIKTHREKNSIVFDQLAVKGQLLIFQGKGKWFYQNKSSQVSIEGSVDIPSMEKLLLAMNHNQIVVGGEVNFAGNLTWQGGLKNISKTNMTGKIHLDAKKGVWLEGTPGAAGRLLGLLNMNALLRRLSFDFSDISEKGFEFDDIKGGISIKNGLLKMDDVVITSSAAKIVITGDTDLVSGIFDQNVTVIPEVSGALPLAGAAVAGPAGAVVVWVGQKILGEHINNITAYGYSVKGNWDEPIIEKAKVNRNSLNMVKELLPVEQPKVNKKKVPKRRDNNPIFDEI